MSTICTGYCISDDRSYCTICRCNQLLFLEHANFLINLQTHFIPHTHLNYLILLCRRFQVSASRLSGRLTALFNKVPSLSPPFLSRAGWYTTCYTEFRILFASHCQRTFTFATISPVAEARRATKLHRTMQKAYRYPLIAKSQFRLTVPKVRFLLATLTYTTPELLTVRLTKNRQQ